MTALSVRPAWSLAAAEAADRKLLRGALLLAAALHGMVLLVPWRQAEDAPPRKIVDPPPAIRHLSIPPPPIHEVATTPTTRRVPLPTIEATDHPSLEPLPEPPPAFRAAGSTADMPMLVPDPQAPPVSARLVYDETHAGLVLPQGLEGRARPVYPLVAVATRRQGTVVLRAVITAEGRVESVEVLSAPRPDYGFADSAVEAVSSWRYTPGTVRGRPVAVAMTVIVDFTMN